VIKGCGFVSAIGRGREVKYYGFYKEAGHLAC